MITFDTSVAVRITILIFAWDNMRRHWRRAAMLPIPGPTMVVPPYLRASLALLWISDTYAEWYIYKHLVTQRKNMILTKTMSIAFMTKQQSNNTHRWAPTMSKIHQIFYCTDEGTKKNGWWVLSRERCMNQWSKANRCDIWLYNYPDMAVFRLGTASGSSIIRVYFAPLRCVKS